MNENKKYDPKPAKTFASLVYVGVVVSVSTLYISFVLTAFPANAYLSRAVMSLAGLLVGASAIAFPIALHTWTIEKNHHNWTTAFYYGEIAIMAINTVVSFMTLLSQNNNYVPPEWATLYEPFSVGAIVYTLFAWGTVFLLDPEHKAIQQDRQFKSDYEKEISNKKMEYLQSIQGEESIALAANEDIQEILRQQRNGKKNFGLPAGATAQNNNQIGFKPNNADTELVELRAEVERLRNQPPKA